MKRKFLSQCCFFLCALFVFSIAVAQQQENIPLGERLEKNLFEAVKTQNWPALENMIAPSCQTIHPDKIRNRSELIAFLKNLRFKDYQFSDVTVKQNKAGNVIVITYKLNFSEEVVDFPKTGKDVNNLSVWEKTNGQWKWIAHAVC